jgi:pyruvate,water dikinase
MPVVRPLAELGHGDIGVAGGKGANLGELLRAGVDVPPGYVVTVEAYRRFLDSSGALDRLAPILSTLDPDDSAALDRASTEIKSILSGAAMPAEVVADVASAYAAMGGGKVAVRSSATAEDLADASFAGQQSTYLNVDGPEGVVKAVQDCWASLFEPRAIHYRAQSGFDHLSVSIAVVVQQMIESERSGVMFTVNPVTGDQSSMIVEAIYGLGEAVVSGVVTPDMYIVEKSTGAVLDRQISAQEQEFVWRPDAAPGEEPNQWLSVPFERRARQKLTDEEITGIAAVGRRIEAHFGRPQDVEWAFADGAFYIVQARPVTAVGG